ncbi:MAG: hypothetical protein ABIQ53_03415 [Terracoccus sp.]
MPRSGSETDPEPSVTQPSSDAADSAVAQIPPDAAPPASAGRASWWPYLAAFVVGAVCVVAGGLVAAVTGPLALVHGSWAAAYLVLVAGVAQIALAGGQSLLARHPVSHRLLLVEFAGWNLGNAAVIAGTLWGAALLVNLGGALLVVALGALLVATRSGPGGVDEVARGQRVALLSVRALVALLLISIPVGLSLAHVRAR